MEEIKDSIIVPNNLIKSESEQIVNTSTITSNSDNTKNINLTDIENQNRIQNEVEELAKKNYELTHFKFTAGLILAVMIIMYTCFIVCDIYFALNDDSCVNQDVSRLDFNLKTFLLVRGFIMLGLIFEIIFTIFTITHSMIEFCTCAQISIFVLISIFMLGWNIIGSVLFWGYMDTSECTNPVYNYTFASLVIAFVGSGINLLTKKSNDKK